MKKIFLIGKMNEVVKDLNSFLNMFFQVQLCMGGVNDAEGLLDVYEADLCMVSLVGAIDIDEKLFYMLKDKYPDLPVLTIGTKTERDKFLKFFSDGQFENLIRPIDYTQVIEALARRLSLSDDEVAEMKEKQQNIGAEEKRQILVVDDNASTLRAIKGMLDDTYSVMLANSGIKAMTAIGKKRPDLILLDYEMPVCDGRQTLEMIRADEELTDIPVIFLTGVNDKEHIEAVVSLRPAGYMLKPPIKDKIIEAIEKALA